MGIIESVRNAESSSNVFLSLIKTFSFIAFNVQSLQKYYYKQSPLDTEIQYFRSNMESYLYGSILYQVNNLVKISHTSRKPIYLSSPYCDLFESNIEKSIDRKNFLLSKARVLIPEVIKPSSKNTFLITNLQHIDTQVIFKNTGEPTGICLMGNKMYLTSPPIVGHSIENGCVFPVFDLSDKVSNFNEVPTIILSRPTEGLSPLAQLKLNLLFNPEES